MPPGVFDPAILGARSRSQNVNAHWLAGIGRDLDGHFAGQEDAESIAQAARTLLEEDGWISTALAPLIAALRNDPWFEPPIRASRDPLRTGAILYDSRQVVVSATVTCADQLRAAPLPATLVVSGRVSITRYLHGGGACMRRWRTAPPPPDFDAATAPPCTELPPLAVQDGAIYLHDGRTQGHLITAADCDIAALTITVKPDAAPLMREYRVADGAFVRAACADEAASRIEMLLTLLRVSGRGDAGEAFDAATRHPAFHLRWAAMREWLMLDARQAKGRLGEMAAGDPNAQVREAAAVTLMALDRRMAVPCPA